MSHYIHKTIDSANVATMSIQQAHRSRFGHVLFARGGESPTDKPTKRQTKLTPGSFKLLADVPHIVTVASTCNHMPFIYMIPLANKKRNNDSIHLTDP